MDEDKRKTEDDKAREHLGAQGVPGKPGQGKITKKQAEQTPKTGEFDGHTA